MSPTYETPATLGVERGLESPAAPSRDTSVSATASHPRQFAAAGEDRTTSRTSCRDPLVGLHLVALQEDGAIYSVQRVRARVTAELLLVEELDLLLEAVFLRIIKLSTIENSLLFENRSHFVFWREYRYQAPCPKE
jgi:hypothetical protein